MLEALLLFAVVPVQDAADALEVLVLLVLDGGERVAGGADGDVVADVELHAGAAVEGGPGGGAAAQGHLQLQVDRVWNHDRSEGKRVRADGRDAHAAHLGVDKAAAGGEGVGRGARRGGDDEAVGLRHGEQAVVAVQLEHRHVGGRPPVDGQLVEHLLLADDVAVALVDAAREAHSEVGLHALGDGLREHLSELLELETRQEPKRA